MKRLLLLLAVVTTAGAAAKAPVEEDILARTMDTASPYYYTALMMRYNAGDETLTDDDYHYLYYGYACQDDYKPLNTNPALERLLLLASGLDAEHPQRETLEAILATGREALVHDPFSPRVLNLMAFAHEASGNRAEARACASRMNGIVRTILASGDGLTQKTPRHVLMFDHALDVMDVEGLPYAKARIVSRTVEFVPFTTPYTVEGRKRKGLYFDFGRVYRNKPEGYTYQRDRTWQFNNLKPRTYK